METTTVSTAAPTQGGVESSITKLLDKVIDSMFGTKSWTRGSLEEGTAGSVSHAKGEQLKAKEGEVLAIVSYTDGTRTFYPSVEVQTSAGVCLANIQGAMKLKKGDKVALIKSVYENKAKEKKDCLDVTGIIE